MKFERSISLVKAQKEKTEKKFRSETNEYLGLKFEGDKKVEDEEEIEMARLWETMDDIFKCDIGEKFLSPEVDSLTLILLKNSGNEE